MHGKLTQPKIDGYISWLRRNDHFGMTSCIYDDKSQKLLDELFELLEQIAPESPNGVRTLWLRAERGPIEDFGNAAEEIAEGNYDSEEEFVDAWKQARGISRCRTSSQLCDRAGQAQRTGRMALRNF